MAVPLSLVATKLTIPLARPCLVPRPRLGARLTAALLESHNKYPAHRFHFTGAGDARFHRLV